jgi:hypothetical protein
VTVAAKEVVGTLAALQNVVAVEAINPRKARRSRSWENLDQDEGMKKFVQNKFCM